MSSLKRIFWFQRTERRRSSSGTRDEFEMHSATDANVSLWSPTATVQSSGLCNHKSYRLWILMSPVTQTIYLSILNVVGLVIETERCAEAVSIYI